MEPPRLAKSTHKNHWIRKLLANGLKPRILAVESAPIEELNDLERMYIQRFRMAGYNLTNATDGGEGLKNPSMETRKKMSAAKLGRPLTPEHRAKVVAHQHSKPIVDQNGLVYRGVKAAARQLGLNPGAVWQVVKGRLKQTGGYTFNYVTD
jgi:hypothetical protein